MMNVVADMLLTDPTPMTIWGALLLAATLAVLAMARADSDRRPHQALSAWTAWFERHRARADHRRREAHHAMRYADEIRQAADRASHAAELWHERWQQTHQRADAAWLAWQTADERLAGQQRAAVFGMPAARTPAEYADRERFLHRAVRAAVAAGDLPAAALTDAVAGRAGWSPLLHPADQEIAVCRAVAAHRRDVHRRAVAAERTAWHDARLADVARDSLHREAVVAATRAAAVRHLAASRPRGQVGMVRATVPATA